MEGIKTIQLNDQKAGMQGLDKESINKVIYEASKGTPYFAFQEKKQNSIDNRVKSLKQALEKISHSDRNSALKRMNRLGETLKATQNLAHSIVHIDMDAFYAAVEMLDNPRLKGLPMAVGSSSMLSTSNYEARKYGVRAGMPGFIAKKLCSSLVILPCNFHKYKEVSKKVCCIIEKYDPNYCPASLDEMYFDLTKYIKNEYKKQLHHNVCLKNNPELLSTALEIESCINCNDHISDIKRDEMAYNIVKEIRQKIFNTTNLTASAGIAPNTMLAKVCSDQHKPNGQYQIESNLHSVENFVSKLPVRKISGIGPIQSQILNAIDINTCADLWEKRDIVDFLFSATSAEFYIQASLGIGRTTVKSDYVRKSIGVEQTFGELHEKNDLMRKCEELCEEAVTDMQSHNMLGKVVVLKYKTTNFESRTRNCSLPHHTIDKEIFLGAAQKLLLKEIASSAPRPLKLRLMGIRIEKLVTEDTLPWTERQQCKIETFLKSKDSIEIENSEPNHCFASTSSTINSDYNELAQLTNVYNSCEKPFTNKSCYMEELSNEVYKNVQNSSSIIFNSSTSSTTPSVTNLTDCSKSITKVISPLQKFTCEDSSNHRKIDCEEYSNLSCPVCQKTSIAQTILDLNIHIDNCLNKVAIKEMLAEDMHHSQKKQVQPNYKSSLKRKRESNLKGKSIDKYFS